MKTREKAGVGVVLETKDGFLLFGRSTVFDGKLIIPGGGVKEGETYKEAGIREMIEETELDLSRYDWKLIADHRKVETKKMYDGEWVRLIITLIDFHVVMHDKNKDEIEIVAGDDFSEPTWIHKTGVDPKAISHPTIWLLQQIGYLKKEL